MNPIILPFYVLQTTRSPYDFSPGPKPGDPSDAPEPAMARS
jgi:hypothetical protein